MILLCELAFKSPVMAQAGEEKMMQSCLFGCFLTSTVGKRVHVTSLFGGEKRVMFILSGQAEHSAWKEQSALG